MKNNRIHTLSLALATATLVVSTWALGMLWLQTQ